MKLTCYIIKVKQSSHASSIGSTLTQGLYLVYKDGIIVEYDVTKNSSLLKVYQTEVPYSKCGYLAFVDKLGGLQIGDGSGQFMININPNTNKKTSLNGQVVPKESKGFDFKTIRFVIGNYLWILGGGHGKCEGIKFKVK